MRPTLGFGLSICLLNGCFAAEPEPVPSAGASKDWATAYGAGVKAYRSADYAAALAQFEKCWPLSPVPLARATVASDLGGALHALNREKESRVWFEQAIEIWRTLPDRADEIATASLGLSDADRALGDLDGAERVLRVAVEVKSSTDTAAQLKNRLGDMMREQGRYEESRSLFAGAAALTGVSRRWQIDTLLGIADLDRQVLRWDESLAESAKALSMARAEGSSQLEALALRCLGLAWLNRNYLSRAEPLLTRSLSLLEADARTSLQDRANAWRCLGAVYRGRNKYAMAEDALLRAVDYMQRASSDPIPQTAIVLEELAEAYAGENRFTEAQGYADRAYSIMRRNPGEQSALAAESLGTVARIEQLSRNLPAAAADYERAIERLRANQNSTDQRLVVMMNRYAAVLNELHRKREAKQLETEIKTFRLR